MNFKHYNIEEDVRILFELEEVKRELEAFEKRLKELGDSL